MSLREGIRQKVLIRALDQTPWAVSLGFDFTAEHEWGVKAIAEKLGIEEKPKNWKNLLVRKTSELHIGETKTKEEDTLYYLSTTEDPLVVKEKLNYLKPKEDMFTFWNWDDFVIFFRREYDRDSLYAKFKEKKMMVGTVLPVRTYLQEVYGKEAGGLIFIDQTHLPTSVKVEIGEYYRQRHNLDIVAKNTQVEQALEKVSQQWKKTFPNSFSSPWATFSIHPTWIEQTSLDETSSEHAVAFFINPMYQDAVASGWFTVEQIFDWVNEEVKEGGMIKDKAEWEKVVFSCKNHSLYSVFHHYKNFNHYESKHWSTGKRHPHEQVRILKKDFDDEETFSTIEAHIKWIMRDALNAQNYITPSTIADYNFVLPVSIQERTFGIFEALSAMGFCYFGAVNHPEEKENASYLLEKLHAEVILEIVREYYPNEIQSTWFDN